MSRRTASRSPARSRSRPRRPHTASVARAECDSDRGPSSRLFARSSNTGPARTRCVCASQTEPVTTPNSGSERLTSSPSEAGQAREKGGHGSNRDRIHGNVASFTDRTKYVPRCLSKMRLLGGRVAGPRGLMSDHAGPEVERDDERERLLRATREDALLVRDERETDVG